MTNLTANAPFTNLVKEKGVYTWEALKDYVANLTYGRTSNPKDLSLVLKEERGTCSGKHALLVCVARENSIPDVHLMVSAFKMSGENAPKVREVLEHFHLDYIPEAHCYIQENGKFEDYTRSGKVFANIASSILDTRELLDPENVAIEKTAYHKQFLENWLDDMFLPYSPEEIWRIREACIMSLSE
ncbi:MAG: hypothetical protein J6Z31_06185 [Fibrobacter sp.]|nr:hypothetical protein [Fibrobacter sp.]